MSLLSSLWALLCCIGAVMYKSAYKWLLTKLTGRCQLLRLLDGEEQGAKRTASVETCLANSHVQLLRGATQWDGEAVTKEGLAPVVRDIAETKDIKAEVHAQFEADLLRCLLQLLGYQRLVRELDTMRRQRFDARDPGHCALLDELWGLLEPDTPLPGPRHSVWETVGFQSDEPGTDFRGMGLLALHNLIYFAATYPNAARRLLSLSRHPKDGYSFAIVGINLTDLAFRLLKEGRLKNHFYNLVQGAPKAEHFHDVYCWIFTRFDEFWRSQGPIDVMMFNPAREKFSAWLTAKLRHKTFLMRPAF